MSSPDHLAQQIAEKTTDELLDMLGKPVDWIPEALDAAHAELLRRNVQPERVVRAEAKRKRASRTFERKQPSWFSSTPVIVFLGLDIFGVLLVWFVVLTSHDVRRYCQQGWTLKTTWHIWNSWILLGVAATIALWGIIVEAHKLKRLRKLSMADYASYGFLVLLTSGVVFGLGMGILFVQHRLSSHSNAMGEFGAAMYDIAPFATEDSLNKSAAATAARRVLNDFEFARLLTIEVDSNYKPRTLVDCMRVCDDGIMPGYKKPRKLEDVAFVLIVFRSETARRQYNVGTDFQWVFRAHLFAYPKGDHLAQSRFEGNVPPNRSGGLAGLNNNVYGHEPWDSVAAWLRNTE